MGVFKGEWVGDDDAVEALLFWFLFLNTLTTFLIDMAATGYDLGLSRARAVRFRAYARIRTRQRRGAMVVLARLVKAGITKKQAETGDRGQTAT